MLAVARWSRLPEWPKRMRLRAVRHWTDFGPFFYETLENRLESQVLGASDMQVSVSIPLVADHPALYGAAEVGLRKFIDNPLTFITDKA